MKRVLHKTGKRALHKTESLTISLRADPRFVEVLERDGWTYALQWTRCNRGACHCMKGSKGHGPYWYAYKRVDGRLVSRYVGKKLAAVESEDGFDDAEDAK